MDAPALSKAASLASLAAMVQKWSYKYPRAELVQKKEKALFERQMQARNAEQGLNAQR